MTSSSPRGFRSSHSHAINLITWNQEQMLRSKQRQESAKAHCTHYSLRMMLMVNLHHLSSVSYEERVNYTIQASSSPSRYLGTLQSSSSTRKQTRLFSFILGLRERTYWQRYRRWLTKEAKIEFAFFYYRIYFELMTPTFWWRFNSKSFKKRSKQINFNVAQITPTQIQLINQPYII